MAKELLTRCGYRCDLCLAYAENIKVNDQRELLSEGWQKIFGIDLQPEEIYCEGCLTCSSDPILVDKGCPVRPCVISKGIENCAQCDDYPCEILETRLVRYEDWVEKVPFTLSRSDRKNFIKPYENVERLKALREKYPEHSRMFNKMIVPEYDDLRLFLGDSDIISKWDEIHNYLKSHYDLSTIIRFGGKDYGWGINYRKGSKSIISYHPERHSFTVLLVFGKKELEMIEGLKEKISEKMVTQINNTHQYHDGKWVWARVDETTEIDDFKILLGVKRNPEK
ncbi:DUF3788 family protein [Chloroflexota bacterium]|nr:DUF3788 family protein [Chloroflexota bacterium]